MKRDWEYCTYDTKRARWSGFHVTMTPRGEIYMNANTLKAMDADERFVLLYDRMNKTIGINPQMPLIPIPRDRRKKGTRGGRFVRGYRLLQQFGISVDHTVRFLKP